MSTLRITEQWEAGIAVVRLDGTLDLPGTTALLTATNRLTDAGARTIICDLEGLHAPADHHLLTVFPAAQRRAGMWPLHVVNLAGGSPDLKRRLRRMGIDRFLGLHDSMDDARLVTGAARLACYRDLSLPPEGRSPAEARRCLATLPDAGPRDWRDAADVVISELTTNVLRHVHRPFNLSLALSPQQLLIGVTDPSRQEPIKRPVRTEASGGRGVQLVDALTDSWGVRLIHQGGKTVWARIGTLTA